MNRFSSYTQTVGVLRLPPPYVAANSVAMQKWYYALNPADRGVYSTYIHELVSRLPRPLQQKIMDRYEQLNASAIGLGDLGLVGAAVSLTSAAIQAGAMVTSAAIQAGSSIYQGRQQAGLQRELSRKGITGQLQATALQEAFRAEVAKAQTEAMKEAAQAAAGAQVLTAQQAAGATVAKTQIITGALKPAILGTVILGGTIGAYLLLTRKKRR